MLRCAGVGVGGYSESCSLYRMRTRVIAVVIAFLPMTVMAGGSFEPVIVETISITGNINYTLVVVPQRSDELAVRQAAR